MSKDNEGAIWKNERREKDTHPHFTGSAMVDGVEYWVSAWKKDADANERAPLVKFSFRPKDSQSEQRPPRRDQRSESQRSYDAQKPAGGAASNEFDDDIPFANHELRGWA